MKIVVVSSSKEIYTSESAGEIYVPTLDGIIGILPNHTNLIAALNIGLLRIKSTEKESEKRIVLNGGLIQVQNNVISILADDAQPAEELVKEEIQKAITDAEQKIAGALDPTELIQLEKQLRYERFKHSLA